MAVINSSENLSDELKADLARVDASGLDPGYERKIFLVNKVLQEEIGMGKFQWQLFALSGYGWLVDNIWLQGVAIILPQVGNEFFDAQHTPWMTFSLYMGLITGAALWGIVADIIGRRPSFNATLFIGGVFGVAAGAAPSFTALGGLLAALGFGVGGSLPVDGMLFLEFIPGSHQYLLTLLSVFWAIGQLISSLLAWAFIANYSCTGSNSNPQPDPTVAPQYCDVSTNNGWRYTFYTLGAITLTGFFLRFLMFQLPESPKYLLSQGRDAEAVAVLRDIARRNGKELPEDVMSLAILRAAAGEEHNEAEDDALPVVDNGLKSVARDFMRIPSDLVKSVKGMNAQSFKPNMAHINPLFATKKVAYNTITLWLIWGFIGLAYPLYNSFLPTYLNERFVGSGVATAASTDATYRDYAIISACGVPGSIIAAWLVELPRSGRRGALAVSTLLTGVFVFAVTGASTDTAYLGLNCANSLVQNSMYGVLYHMTPESFPAPARGTGDGVASSLNRVFGSMAPIIKIYAGTKAPSAPVFTSAAIFCLAAFLAATLTVEGHGKSAL
ncbi:MFS general substrate transporter [Jaminaea rosea]|uniref:MFS general substrate transporter n=1 Tax=Jaminaea rosea TaxID=1569628 RepID=A0A316UNW4_9BASI|nr:MFS general substrate transporter [Jaminaea rosea]PWN26041.1 MFS general substrate transporter [Jaminaea rosea]